MLYSLVYWCYFHLIRRRKKYLSKGEKFPKIYQKIIDYCEWFYNIPLVRWYRKHPSKQIGLNTKKRDSKIIVSLTSYPKRINTVWITIETLLRQSMKPDAIILWLADTQFNGLNSLPRSLLKLQNRGLTIQFCEDMRSHKKYLNVMQEFPEDIIILVDDDMFYPRDTVSKLMKLHAKFPDDICTMTAQYITPNFESPPSGWRNPLLSEKIVHSDRLQIFTGSGSLYPPHCLDISAFNRNLIRQYCLNADDLWLTFMANRKNTKITMMNPWRAFPVTIYGTNEGSLYYINAEQNQNDVQWNNLIENLNQ